MRLILVLLLSVALAASAGCFGQDDEGTEPTPTTPADNTTTTPTPTPTTPTPEEENETEPEAPAPKEVFSQTYDFGSAPSPDPADPAGATHPTTTVPFTVDAGYTTLTLNVTWGLSTPAGLSSGITVEIHDPAGSPIATCAVAQGPVQAAPEPCTQTATIPATGGEYMVVFGGSGTLTAQTSVVAS